MSNFILLTGATSDIGKQIANKFRDKNLILCGRNKKELENLFDTLNNKNNKILTLDLSNIQDIQSLNEIGGGIESFIHCAGAVSFFSIKQFDYKLSKEMFDINFFSACYIIKYLTSKNNKNYLKNIIFISSISAKLGYKAMSIYSSSKASLDSLTRNLAVELSPKVRVNSISLAGIKTKKTEFLYNDDFIEKIKQNYPLGEGNVEDVANLVEFLCKEDSRWITGQNIILDGGLSIMGK